VREAEKLTGLQASGIPPLALLNRAFQVVVDVSAQLFEKIDISGGQPGLNICLAPADLASLTNARYGEITI
jgi:Cys-tRNA(Pro)/Cys-tRNA(Cys) deacylase